MQKDLLCFCQMNLYDDLGIKGLYLPAYGDRHVSYNYKADSHPISDNRMLMKGPLLGDTTVRTPEIFPPKGTLQA